MRAALILIALTLTACGADAPPERPTGESGLTVSGEVILGVSTRID